VKLRLDAAMKSLPADVKYTLVYDRTALIDRAVETLQAKLIEEASWWRSSACCSCCIFAVRSWRSSSCDRGAGGVRHHVRAGHQFEHHVARGIAIAIGAMVDAVIIMIENAHKHLERDRGKKPHWDIIRDASIEVGRRFSTRCS